MPAGRLNIAEHEHTSVKPNWHLALMQVLATLEEAGVPWHEGSWHRQGMDDATRDLVLDSFVQYKEGREAGYVPYLSATPDEANHEQPEREDGTRRCSA